MNQYYDSKGQNKPITKPRGILEGNLLIDERKFLVGPCNHTFLQIIYTNLLLKAIRGIFPQQERDFNYHQKHNMVIEKSC